MGVDVLGKAETPFRFMASMIVERAEPALRTEFIGDLSN
jgi:hypothetical protein